MTTAANSGVATCWLTVNPTGSRLYTANNADNSVSAYDLTDPLAPVELQHLGLTRGSAAYQLCLDPAGDVLYVVSTSAHPVTRKTMLEPQLRQHRECRRGQTCMTWCAPPRYTTSPDGAYPGIRLCRSTALEATCS